MASPNPCQSPVPAEFQPVTEPVAKDATYRSLKLLTLLLRAQCWLMMALLLLGAFLAFQGQQFVSEMQLTQGGFSRQQFEASQLQL